MIEEVFTCDLCREQCWKSGSSRRGGKRLKFRGREVELRELTDREASDRVVCDDCISALKRALK